MQEIKLHIKGLYTNPSDLAAVPDGALTVADNIVINNEDIAEPRRGFGRSFVALPSSATAKRVAMYQNYLIAHTSANVLAYYTTQLNSNTANFTGSGAWTTSGSGTFTTTVTIASPAVFTATAHGLAAGTPITLTTTGALPTGLTAGTTYYIVIPTANTFELAATAGGTAINTSGSQSGTHTLTYGYFFPVTGNKLKFAEANQNLYYTTAAGVYKLDAYNSTPVLAGAYKGLDVQASIVSVTGNWLLTNNRVAYRVLWGIKDANKNLIQGTPSQREVITNTTGATAAVSLAITIPAGVTTAWFYQIYRSVAVVQPNDGTVTEPTDELALVYEANPTSGQITAGTLSVNDIVPDSLRGAIIYTAATQQGLANGNERPPLAADIAVYRNVAFYANTVSKNRQFVSLLAVGGTNGLAIGDTVTVGGVVYTAAATESAASGQFRAYTTSSFTFSASVATPSVLTATAHGLQNGDAVTLTTTGALPTGLATATAYYVVAAATNTFELAATPGGAGIGVSNGGSGTPTCTLGSPSQNIRATAVSLVRAVNQYASSTVYAYYLSSTDDLPGKLLLEERSIGGAAFTSVSTNATCWSPNLNATQTSVNDVRLNGLAYSKTSQPEFVPLPNNFFVGSANKKILRILPLRDSLFILKEDGVYRLSGQDANSFRVDLFDSTTHLLAPDSAVVLNNQIFALTDQGVAAISESGVQVRSRPIEYDLLSLQGQNYSVLQTESFGISYETERKYVLFVPTLAADSTPTQAYVFNTFTNTWTRWPLSKTCGLVNLGDDKLYLGDSATSYVNQERKAFTYQDYVDYGFASTITGVSGLVLTMNNTDQINIGDVIYQSSSVYSTVSAVDPIAGTVTTSISANFTAAATDVLKAISSSIQWVPFTGSNPMAMPGMSGNAGLMKQFREVSVLFKSDFTGNGTLVFTSDTSPSQESETLTGTGIGTWGLFSWGQVGWGGANLRRPIRVYVPSNKQRCSQLTVTFKHSTGYAKYQINGLSLISNLISEKVAY